MIHNPLKQHSAQGHQLPQHVQGEGENLLNQLCHTDNPNLEPHPEIQTADLTAAERPQWAGFVVRVMAPSRYAPPSHSEVIQRCCPSLLTLSGVTYGTNSVMC